MFDVTVSSPSASPCSFGRAGLLGGVMIYVSLVEVFQKARHALSGPLGDQAAARATVAGMAVMALSLMLFL